MMKNDVEDLVCVFDFLVGFKFFSLEMISFDFAGKKM